MNGIFPAFERCRALVGTAAGTAGVGFPFGHGMINLWRGPSRARTLEVEVRWLHPNPTVEATTR